MTVVVAVELQWTFEREKSELKEGKGRREGERRGGTTLNFYLLNWIQDCCTRSLDSVLPTRPPLQLSALSVFPLFLLEASSLPPSLASTTAQTRLPTT
jgi:hypothetical protein